MNRLQRVDELVRHFDAGLGIRATARATGCARATVGRYHRMWRTRRPSVGRTLVIGISPPAAAGLALAASTRGTTAAALATLIIEAVVEQDLSGIVLA